MGCLECTTPSCPKMSEDVFKDIPRCGCALPDRWGILPGMPATAPHISAAPANISSPRGLTRDEVMTASEVAELLHLPVSTVYYLARRGEIPACRLGRAWRFLRPRIEEKLAA